MRMKSANSLLCVLCVFVLFLSAISGKNARSQKDIVQEILAAMNKTVDPCADFYQYSCGGWISSTVLPPDEPLIYKSLSGIEDNNQLILKSILETEYNHTLHVDARLLSLYKSCMNTALIERAGTVPLEMFSWHIDVVVNLTTFMTAVAFLHSNGFDPLFEFGPVLDSKNPDFTIAQFAQGGVALPDPSLYEDGELMSDYSDHIINMFMLAGRNKSQAALAAKNVILLESSIAAITTPPDQLVNPFDVYNKIDLEGLQKLSPKIPWKQFFDGIGYPAITQITVDVPSFFSGLSNVVADKSAAVLRDYLWWFVLHGSAPYLTKAFVDEDFSFFGAELEGLSEQSPRWDFCVDVVDQKMGMLLGDYYVDIAFSGASKQKVSSMIKEIEDAMHGDLETIEWMDDITRTNAIAKLGLVSNQVGSPNQLITYDGLVISDDLFYGNIINADVWQFEFDIDQIQKRSNKDLWEMTPPEVNAYYDPTKNGMVFPAGILQTPLFDVSFPEAVYYGGIGMVMGHELTHGFDNEGRDYDGEGVLRDWWQPDTSKKFDELASCVINQYSKFEILPGVYVNGNLTQGENIADMGGTKLSYLALQKAIGDSEMKKDSVVPGLTNEQLFFVSFAQGWCAVETPEIIKIRIATDPHSPPKFRVIGPLINHPYFASVFKCPAGSYMNPANKCYIW